MPWSTSRYWMLAMASSLKAGGRAGVGFACMAFTAFPLAGMGTPVLTFCPMLFKI